MSIPCPLGIGPNELAVATMCEPQHADKNRYIFDVSQHEVVGFFNKSQKVAADLQDLFREFSHFVSSRAAKIFNGRARRVPSRDAGTRIGSTAWQDPRAGLMNGSEDGMFSLLLPDPLPHCSNGR